MLVAFNLNYLSMLKHALPGRVMTVVKTENLTTQHAPRSYSESTVAARKVFQVVFAGLNAACMELLAWPGFQKA